MRNILAWLGTTVRRNNGRGTPRLSEAPAHPSLFEAQVNAAYDIDAIWYYERLKWQARD
jgi:hypothetical protein